MLWAPSISVGEGGFQWLSGQIITTVVAALEVFRRFVWNFFRLENEHLNNCGQFRAVRDISIHPLNLAEVSAQDDREDNDLGSTVMRTIRWSSIVRRASVLWSGDSNTEIEVIAPSLIHDVRSGRLAATNMIAENTSTTNSAVASMTTAMLQHWLSSSHN